MKLGKWEVTQDMILRASADLVMVNVALLLAFFAWFSSETLLAHSFALVWQNFAKNIHTYELSFLGISIISLLTYSSCGFYTMNRAYKSKYKALVIIQAVSISYLIFGFSAYWLNAERIFPRSVIVLGWGITLATILSSRLWSVLWKMTVAKEINQSTEPVYVDKKAVLVIGGAGYIGSALLPKLLNEGYKVRLLDLFVYGDEPIKEYAKHENLEIIKADFRQVDKIVEAVRGVGSVIHLGAIVGDPACALSEELTIEVNLMATKMIAEVCKGFHVERFIFASTCSVYGASNQVLNERSKLNPVSLYAKTKIACENALQEMADRDSSFSPVILRFSTIYGLSGRTRFDLVVNLLTAKACFENKITVMGGDQWRPFLHVDDAAESVFCALKAPLITVKRQVYNVGGEELNYTIGQVGELISKIVPEAELMDLGMDGDRRNYRVNFNKIQQHLGFVPKWDLQKGIEQVINAIRQGSVLNYEESRFSNAKVLQEDSSNEYMESRYYYSMQNLVDIA